MEEIAFKFDEMMRTIGPNAQLYMALGVSLLVFLPCMFFKSPFGTLAQAIGFIFLGIAVYLFATDAKPFAGFGFYTLAAGGILVATGASARHHAKMRDELHLQNLRVLKLLAQNIPKKKPAPPRSPRQEIERS